MRARYSLLVEVGKAGFADIRTDFPSFFETDEIEIPALIVGGAKREERELKYSARIKLNVVGGLKTWLFLINHYFAD